MKKIMRVFLILLGIAALLAIVAIVVGTGGMKEIREYQIPAVDMSIVKDGLYRGSSSISRWALDVLVTVKNHQVTDIHIVNKKGSNLTHSLKEKIDEEVVGQETPRFDAVSGASMTSKGYLIAIVDALTR